ncbi:MAG: RsmD family RNA methyltransferase [Bacteroidia bacterium]|nr:RsmD family RNA methyltransferase [Bacteroidia bacterium]NNF31284.1 methyltransferase [Flavobacteriaceae bacterium]MBT8274624.1 RsmD family RNA methyltransferase [Bacteroidia bacterium]NNJ83036.1 methyltransferase [Flavobacteriaceae bacterium]NNK54206.1 methyltransferase [Flavobacteriaceae bacterium]
MRIVSGKFKGKRIIAPKKLPVRPTTDFAKEALFNILNNRYDFGELRVLDLFAGTGNISYEFASRGTKEILCVDAHYACVKFIQQTAMSLEIPITTVKSDVFKYLRIQQDAYDIIFADPPYDFSSDQLEELVSLSFGNNLVREEGCLIIEHTKHLDLSEISHFQESRKYGGSVFSFFT